MELDDLLTLVEQESAGKGYGYISDIYLQPDRPPFFYVCKRWMAPGSRLLGNLQGFKVTRDYIRKIISTCLERNTEKDELVGRESGTHAQTDFAFDWVGRPTAPKAMVAVPDGAAPQKVWRLRAHVSYNNLGQSLTLRLLTRDIPSIEELNLPRQIKNMVHSRSGLVLICGPTGGGKSTTMASMVKTYAASRFGHIATLEDPIEYVLDFPDRLVTQQMVGRHVESWTRGIYHALRDKVELLVIGEMRDPDSIRAAIQAASAGHLVMASTHYTSSTRVLNALVNVFPPHEIESMKHALLSCLIGVVCQNLLPCTKAGHGSVMPCYEVMFNTAEIRANLMQNSFNVLDGLLGSSKSRELGNIRWRTRLQEMVQQQLITEDVYDFYLDVEAEMQS